MQGSFSTKIEQYSFDKDGVKLLKEDSLHGEDWPVVYILSGNKNVMNYINQYGTLPMIYVVQ